MMQFLLSPFILLNKVTDIVIIRAIKATHAMRNTSTTPAKPKKEGVNVQN